MFNYKQEHSKKTSDLDKISVKMTSVVQDACYDFTISLQDSLFQVLKESDYVFTFKSSFFLDLLNTLERLKQKPTWMSIDVVEQREIENYIQILQNFCKENNLDI